MPDSSNLSMYALKLDVPEIANVPYTSGSCFVEIQIRDTAKWSSSQLSALSQQMTDSKENSVPGIGSDKESLFTGTNSVAAATVARKIHNFKCNFNFRLDCNLRFRATKKSKKTASKYLLVRVFVRHDKTSKHEHHQVSELGRVSIDLAEYSASSKVSTSKYLLRHSKVNSILSISIGLSPLSPNYDFHTSLNIGECVSLKSQSQKHRLTSNSFQVSLFERNSFLPVLPNDSSQSQHKNSQTIPDSSNSLQAQGSNLDSNSFTSSKAQYDPTPHPELMDSLITKLYCKVLELAWDTSLPTLLDHDPQSRVNAIFDDEKTGDHDSKHETDEEDSDSESDQEPDSSLKHVNGLFSETEYRDNLRSWLISTKAWGSAASNPWYYSSWLLVPILLMGHCDYLHRVW